MPDAIIDGTGGGYPKRITQYNEGINIDSVHQWLHDGKFFLVGHTTSGLADQASAYFILQTSGTTTAHIGFNVSAGGDALFDIWRAPTIATTGTQITPVNGAEYSSKTALTDAYHSPIVSDSGTLLPICRYIPGGTGPQAVGGGDGELARGPELVIKKNSTLMVGIKNISGKAIYVSINSGFYEPDNNT